MSEKLRIAERWFERKTIGDGITWLTEPHVHTFLRCNIWHVRGRDRDLLVDTGMGIASLRDEIQDLVDKALVAVATHVHYDHAGSLHEFDDRRIHRLEVEKMADYQETAWIRRDDFPPPVQEFLEQAGYGLDGEFLMDARPSDAFDPSSYQVKSTSAEPLDEGEIVDLGDRSFEVLHLPGHTPGSIGLYEKGSGTLFSGDAIYDGFLLDELPESDIAAYVKTMKRLRELPVTTVHAGHEPSFGRERLVELVDAYLESRS